MQEQFTFIYGKYKEKKAEIGTLKTQMENEKKSFE